MNRYRGSVWFAILWCVLIGMVIAGFWLMQSSRKRLFDAQTQMQECESIVADIKSLQSRRGFAALGIDSPRTITARAEEARAKANLSPTALVRIEPQSAIRLRDSEYRLRPTRLELRRVSLEQVVSFTHAMIDEAQGTTVRDIRLTASDGSGNGAKEVDVWNVEVVLTQLIFSPRAR